MTNLLAAPCAALLALTPPPAARPVWVEREIALMGTTLRAIVAAPDRTHGISAIEHAFAAVRRVDDLLSTWRGESEIARVNRAAPGDTVVLSGELYRLLRESAAWVDSTGGAFDPAVGALVDAWDLRGAGRLPSALELAEARGHTGMSRFDFLDGARAVIRRDDRAWLDTGGFGKGVALRLAAEVLRREGVRSALLNFGGQVHAFGPSTHGGDWLVAVAHPSRRSEPALRLHLRDRSASTSAQSEHFVEINRRRLGHIVDPRSGEPVSAWGSVTVVARDPGVADILSTALLVLGPDAGLAWARERSDIGVLVLVERNGSVRPRWNRGMEPFLVLDSTLVRGG